MDTGSTMTTAAGAAARAAITEEEPMRVLSSFSNLTDGEPYNYRDDSPAVESQDVLHFIGFLAWYTFLVLCCVLPTFCAFKRRRLYERRLQRELYLQQMASIQLQMQLQEEAEAVVDEEVRKERRRCIQIAMEETTMVVTESDLVENPNKDGDNNEHTGCDNDDEPQETTLLQLPQQVRNGNRTVPASCAICLCPYEVEDRVSHSPNSQCSHAFHETCIVEWLSKKSTRLCPCCRQEFCGEVDLSRIPSMETGDSNTADVAAAIERLRRTNNNNTTDDDDDEA